MQKGGPLQAPIKRTSPASSLCNTRIVRVHLQLPPTKPLSRSSRATRCEATKEKLQQAAKPPTKSNSRGRPAAPKAPRRRPPSPSRPLDVKEAPVLPDRSLLQYEREGFLVTRQLLPPAQLHEVKTAVKSHIQENKLEALRQRCRVLCPSLNPASITSEPQALRALAKHATQELGFLQFFHLRRSLPQVQHLATNRALAATAAQLLGAKRVRLYQDCVFLKEPGYAETNWHSDLRMAPFDTNHFVTAWVPLRGIKSSQSDSGLLFAVGSHRDFALPFWHDLEGRALDDRGYPLKGTGAMQVGDVSWHHGWTLHCAGVQPQGSQPRLALTVSYFADGARLLARRGDPSVYRHMMHSEDAESYSGWLEDLKDGAVADHNDLPLVYP